MRQVRGLGGYAIFVLLVVGTFVIVYYFTGQDALGATARLLWNAAVFGFNALVELFGSLLGLLARGVGWRRLSRLAAVVGSVGLGYAGSVVLSDRSIHRAHTWRDKAVAFLAAAGAKWHALPLTGKLLVVAALVASQVWLHSILIVFPIAFLVPVVRNLWVQTADLAFGGWYWKTFGHFHRAVAGRLRRMPITRRVIGGIRLARIRYLCAWRLWRYDPRYRTERARGRRVSLVEPIRLWRRGELDRYVGHPLLAGKRQGAAAGAGE